MMDVYVVDVCGHIPRISGPGSASASATHAIIGANYRQS